jgi:hypothetical protein
METGGTMENSEPGNMETVGTMKSFTSCAHPRMKGDRGALETIEQSRQTGIAVGHATLIRAPVLGPMIPMSSMFTRLVVEAAFSEQTRRAWRATPSG